MSTTKVEKPRNLPSFLTMMGAIDAFAAGLGAAFILGWWPWVLVGFVVTFNLGMLSVELEKPRPDRPLRSVR